MASILPFRGIPVSSHLNSTNILNIQTCPITRYFKTGGGGQQKEEK